MYGPIRDPTASPWALWGPVGTRRAPGGPLAAPTDPVSKEPLQFGRPAAPIGVSQCLYIVMAMSVKLMHRGMIRETILLM